MTGPFPSAFAGPQASPGFRFWTRFMAWQRGVNTALGPTGLTQPQFAMLAVVGWLTREGKITTQAEVLSLTGMERMHVSQLLSRLETMGLIARSADPQDTRRKTVACTDLGREKLAQALPLVERFDATFFAAA